MYVDGILNLYLKCNNQVQIAVEFKPFSRWWNIFFRSSDFPFVFSYVSLPHSHLSEHFFVITYTYSLPLLSFLKFYGAGLGQKQRNTTTDFIYGVLTVVFLDTGVGIRDNLNKLLFGLLHLPVLHQTLPWKRSNTLAAEAEVHHQLKITRRLAQFQPLSRFALRKKFKLTQEML